MGGLHRVSEVHCVTDSSPLRVDSIVARLERPLAGERQMALGELAEALWERHDREGVEPPARLMRGPRWEFSARSIQVRVRPEPNAPQLIRLVRHPYVQEVVRPRKQQVREARERIEGPPPFVNAMREAAAERPVIAPHNPVRDRIRPNMLRRPWEIRRPEGETP